MQSQGGSHIKIDIETLKHYNFCLMTDENGAEILDTEGNLLVYKEETGECITVPNVPAVRNLYDLPPIAGPSKAKGLDSDSDENKMVWIGGKTERCKAATRALIRLCADPKYMKLMNDRTTVKLKVWEKIACDLQLQGYKIANTSREAGLRTFQKWRNMERSYWKYVKNPIDFGDDKRRKKPYFFDEFHAVMLRRRANPMVSDHSKTTIICRPFSQQTLNALTNLVKSPKYNQYFKNLEQVPNHIWECIYEDLKKAGWKLAETTEEGAMLISERWKRHVMLNSRKIIEEPRTLYTPTLRKSILLDLDKQKKSEPFIPDESYFTEMDIRQRKLKEGEIEPNVIKELLTLIDSGRFPELFSMHGAKKAKSWEKIYEELKEMGLDVFGETKREKVTRLFQKWRNMKKAFVRYQTAKIRGRELRKPLFYDLLFRIISKDLLQDPNLFAEEESEVTDPTDCLKFLKIDHDYEKKHDYKPGMTSDLQSDNLSQTGVSLSPQSNRNRSGRSYEALLQIREFQKNAFEIQQKFNSDLLSLQTKQIHLLTNLNNMIAELVSGLRNSSRDLSNVNKNGHKTQQS